MVPTTQLQASGSTERIFTKNDLASIFDRAAWAESSSVSAWHCARCAHINESWQGACELCDGNKAQHAVTKASNHVPATAFVADGHIFDIKGVDQSLTVESLKILVAAETGIRTARQKLFLLDDIRPNRTLENNELIHKVLTYTKSQCVLKIAVVVDMNEPEWDFEWKGGGIALSEQETVATCIVGVRGHFVRSKDALEPNSGIHCFEYVYALPDHHPGSDLGGCLVGVVSGSVPSLIYSMPGGISNNRAAWWGLDNHGRIFDGSNAKNRELGTGSPAFRSGDRIGFAIDTNEGTMTFFHNGVPMEGAQIQGVPTDEQLHLLACPCKDGVSVKVTCPVEVRDWTQQHPVLLGFARQQQEQLSAFPNEELRDWREAQEPGAFISDYFGKPLLMQRI
jgi:hypothetical protein